jgi:hypothetical protein
VALLAKDMQRNERWMMKQWLQTLVAFLAPCGRTQRLPFTDWRGQPLSDGTAKVRGPDAADFGTFNSAAQVLPTETQSTLSDFSVLWVSRGV